MPPLFVVGRCKVPIEEIQDAVDDAIPPLSLAAICIFCQMILLSNILCKVRMVMLEHPKIEIHTWFSMKKTYLDSDFNNSLELKILSDSMLPVLKTLDRVRIRGTKFHPIKIGSIILFVHFADHATIHRVVAITELNGKTYYRTKGDANLQKDYYLVPESDVIGILEDWHLMLFTCEGLLICIENR